MNQLPTAVFLDRDGTIIEDAHYISRPEQVKLVGGAAAAIARINAALIPVIVVTNQSGIGRWYFSEEEYAVVAARTNELLAAHGAHVDATYYCPHAPAEGCECRKPGVLLFRRAAEEHSGIDLSRALYIGDRWRDLEPGLAEGGTAVLVPSPQTLPDEILRAVEQARVAPSLATAIDWILCTN